MLNPEHGEIGRGKKMKTRKVILNLEVETNIPMYDLRNIKQIAIRYHYKWEHGEQEPPFWPTIKVIRANVKHA